MMKKPEPFVAPKKQLPSLARTLKRRPGGQVTQGGSSRKQSGAKSAAKLNR